LFFISLNFKRVIFFCILGLQLSFYHFQPNYISSENNFVLIITFKDLIFITIQIIPIILAFLPDNIHTLFEIWYWTKHSQPHFHFHFFFQKWLKENNNLIETGGVKWIFFSRSFHWIWPLGQPGFDVVPSGWINMSCILFKND